MEACWSVCLCVNRCVGSWMYLVVVVVVVVVLVRSVIVRRLCLLSLLPVLIIELRVMLLYSVIQGPRRGAISKHIHALSPLNTRSCRCCKLRGIWSL